MALIPPEVIDRLKQEVDLVSLVRAKGVNLTKHGRDLIGLCPFHNDKEPSLVVTPEKNLWHCLGSCNDGGDAIEWLMKAEGISFRHAVELLREGNGHGLVAGDKVVKKSSVPRLPIPVDVSAEDHQVLEQVVDYYHEVLKKTPAALDYLAKRGIRDEEALSTFRLGFADRTLGLRIPHNNRQEGKEIRSRLMELGIYRKSGHEHFNGCLVFPVMDEEGRIREIYGRKIGTRLRAGTPLHLYLPGPHAGMWNPRALISADIILCESIIDALTFWVNGHRNVTAAYGISGFTDEMLASFIEHGVKKVYIAYDRDDAGNKAAITLSEKLVAEGFTCYRITFPRNMDANEYALKVTPADKSLNLLITSSAFLGTGSPPPDSESSPEMPVKEAEKPVPILDAPLLAADQTGAAKGKNGTSSSSGTPVPATVKGAAVEIALGDRLYRILNLSRNNTIGVMKINMRVMLNGNYHVDNVDLYSHKNRTAFIDTSSAEIKVDREIIKRDLGRILLKLEELQEDQIKKIQEPKNQPIALSADERQEALTLLRKPDIMERIVTDFDRCGVVGERTNKLVGYLASVSRKLEKPLGIIIQSSSSAGKTFLMESILSFMPKEEWEKYSAMTGQSLFYLGETDLQYKILAIVEEEGADRATYPLKLLQSEGELTIASTGKDANTGKLTTNTYHIEGPVVLIISTTDIEIDEELQNRCVVLTVNEDREQTRAIHQLQRKLRTLEGYHLRQDWAHIRAVHRNAQRLLKPLQVINPYAPSLTFLDIKTRTRRDHMKYLTLIESITLLHQYQRSVKNDVYRNKVSRYIEVSLEDIEIANRLASEVLGRSLDELPPQTRRLLNMVYKMVSNACEKQKIDQEDYRFTRKTVRDYTGWGNTQLKIHLHRLEELEYLLVHQGSRGRRFVYELLYRGEGTDGSPFLMGLIDVDKLRSRGKRVKL